MWVPLHVHSQYSILDASASISSIAEKSAEFGLSAVALTDHGNMHAAVEFYKACLDVKIKPIIGCEIYVAPESRLDRKKISNRADYHLTLLAKNIQGYQNLCKLSSIGFIEGFYYHPRIDYEVLEKYKEGLICLSGCLSSRLAAEILNGSTESIRTHIQWFQRVFGEDYYLEMQRHQMSEEDLHRDGFYQETWLYQNYQEYIQKQQKVNEALITLSKECSLPLVATNDSHYINREDWREHEILLNVQSGEPCEILEKDAMGNPKYRQPNPKRRVFASHEYYFKSPAQMQALFADIPAALSNSLRIAEKCDLKLDFKTKHYPVYVPPFLENTVYTNEERSQAVEKFLWQLCEEGIQKRYDAEKLAKVKEIFPDKDPLITVRDRLEYEMSVIVPKEMSDYLLIVWDFIFWAKKNHIPVGPGRGSGAGSIVLYLIGVTDIEPLRFHLFFERFINPERISYPDIDVDICMERRGEVIQYTLEKYGKDNVAQIVTFGTMKARMAIKDVGRVLSVPLSKVNEIAKLVPEDLNITLEKALEKDPDLRAMYESDEDAKRIIDIGKKLEGSIRSTGIHAAGIIISGASLSSIIPICNAKDSEMPATQYSMKPVEMVGMLKVDFLGLKTLTAIQTCVAAVKATKGELIDWVNLPLDNGRTFDLLNQGKTLGIFQLESAGMQDLARQLHLDKFEEIIAVGALYRPGPMDMIPSFINRKHGREPIENDHPWMKDILAETYGIMVYQEQVMQIASKLARYSLGEGDVLRRAMGKKDMAQMAQEREKFRTGAIENGILEETSMLIFDKMEKFAAYGFNKSHAAAYGYLSYVTAYLKANHPKEWMAALMTCDRDDLSKVAKFIREAQAMGIAILSPDVNEAGTSFTATPQGIRFAMNGIKGIGTGVVETIIQERNRGGAFTNFYQFFKRIDLKKVGKKGIENLVDAGCFDFTNWSRDALRQSIDPMYETALKEQKEVQSGVLTFFDLMGATSEAKFSLSPQVLNPTSKQNILLKEKELLGFFLTGHPLDDYQEHMRRLSCVSFEAIDNLGHDAVFRAAVIIESLQLRLAAKSQKKFAILRISDGIESYELPIWPDLYEQKSELLKENQPLYVVLQVDKKEENIRLSCKWLNDLTKVDDTMIEACDQAYDRAKYQAGRSFPSKNAPAKENSPGVSKNGTAMKTPVKEKEVKPKKCQIKLDMQQIRHSHTLLLKKIFRNYPGNTPVELSYCVKGQELATLSLDAASGILFNANFKEEIQQMTAILEIQGDIES